MAANPDSEQNASTASTLAGARNLSRKHHTAAESRQKSSALSLTAATTAPRQAGAAPPADAPATTCCRTSGQVVASSPKPRRLSKPGKAQRPAMGHSANSTRKGAAQSPTVLLRPAARMCRPVSSRRKTRLRKKRWRRGTAARPALSGSKKKFACFLTAPTSATLEPRAAASTVSRNSSAGSTRAPTARHIASQARPQRGRSSVASATAVRGDSVWRRHASRIAAAAIAVSTRRATTSSRTSSASSANRKA